MPRYRRFQDASMSERILDTMFLLTIGIGYLFALVHIYFSHQGRDGEPGLSVEDIQIAYYGTHHQTRLGAALNGSMAGNLDSPAKREVVFDWIRQGADRETFEAEVAPILENNCVACHSPASGMGLPPLTTYEEVTALTGTDTGASVQSLVRVSHIHLFGIAFMIFMVGRIFILCEMPVLVKRVTVAIPFVAMLLDIFSWYITKVVPGFAWVVIAAGGLMSLSIGAQILVSLYQLWFFKPNMEHVEL